MVIQRCTVFFKQNLGVLWRTLKWTTLGILFLQLSEVSAKHTGSLSSSPTALSAQDHRFLSRLFHKPSQALLSFYHKTGLEDWPFQSVLGKLNPSKRQVVIVVYSSLSCTHCADFYINTVWPLHEKYGDDLCFVMRDRPLDIYALQATLLTHCHPEHTSFFQKILFSHQKEWIPHPSEREFLNPESAHALVKKRICSVSSEHDHCIEGCSAYLSFDTLQKAAQMLSHNAAFQTLTSTPVIHMYVPQKGKTPGECIYEKPRNISLASTSLEVFEKIVNEARAKLCV